MLEIDRSLFVLVDVQDKLTSVMAERERLCRKLACLTRGLLALEIPIIWFEQIPQKMGPTIPELAALLKTQSPLSKSSFSCFGHKALADRISETDRNQIIIAGIETHVCVYQTTRDLLHHGCHVEVVADAVSSRTLEDRSTALQRMQSMGAALTTVEMVLFDLMRTAEHPAFRSILKLVK